MSRKSVVAKKNVMSKKTDRRVLRTRDVLGDALLALMQEKHFDGITVQEVLDRAKIGRSTFYTHFRDKEDLHLSDADDFYQSISTALSRAKDKSDRVAPVQEFFAHVCDFKNHREALISSGKLQEIMELGQEHFARGIEQRFAEVPRGSVIPKHRRAALAHAHAGALFSLLSWWIHRGMRESPEEMDELFHQTVWFGAGPEDGFPKLRLPDPTHGKRWDFVHGKK